MSFDQAVTMLSHDCTRGCKKNSQGNVSYWKSYKLHLDVTDAGIPEGFESGSFYPGFSCRSWCSWYHVYCF